MPDSARLTSRSGAEDAAASLSFLDGSLWRALAESGRTEDAAAVWLRLQVAQIAGVVRGVVVLGPAERGPFGVAARWPADTVPPPNLTRVAELAMAERRGVARRASEAGGSSCVALPLLASGQLLGVVALECGADSEADLAYRMRQLQWGLAQLEAIALRRQPQDAARMEQRLRQVLDHAVACLEADGFDMAASVLVNRLAATLQASRVMLGTLGGGHITVRALSGAAQVNLKANLVQAVAAAMHEAVDQHATVSLPAPEDTRLLNRAHRELAQAEAYQGLCTVVIYDQAQAMGALLIEREQPFDRGDVELLEQIAATCGPLLQLKLVGDRTLPVVARDALRRRVELLFGPSHAAFKATTLVLALALLVPSLVKGEYRVRGNAVLEGAIERVVTAPYAGYVSQGLARPGDVVEEGQALAALEDKDLRLELARWLSQRAQIERQYLEAMAQRERAGSQIAKAQMDQADAQIALLNEQVARSTLEAPFRGVVVSGDLSRSIGEPVERGQILFKIAPLEDYRIVLEVDERDVTALASGQRGELVLTPRPDLALPFEVARVTPVASVAEGVNAFRVEARLLEPGADLRPGMTGTGKIEVGERRLIWIWTHPFFNWLRVLLWRWLP